MTMVIKVDRRLLGTLIIGLVGAVLAGNAAFSQTAAQVEYLFNLGPYPGGTLHTVFELRRVNADGVEVLHYRTTDIVPDGDLFKVTEIMTGPSKPADQITGGLGKSGTAGVVGARYDEENVANIDLSPLQTLDERNVELQPNQNYYLPDGARLVTHDWERIAGIDVLMATFVHPNFPNQVVELGLTSPEIGALLSFPALIIRKVDGKVHDSTRLIEFKYTPGE